MLDENQPERDLYLLETSEQASINRIAARAKQLSQLPHAEWLAELHKMASEQRKANCAFCQKYPEQCS